MEKTRHDFDESVQRALEKWPNVPNCFGWLSLSRRGQWLIKNMPITHQGAISFLNRNYASDDHGRWFVQNGPQRVFCDLAYTPFIYRLQGDYAISNQCDERCDAITSIIVDDIGNLLLLTPLGIGLLDDRDLQMFSQRITPIEGCDADSWYDYEQVTQAHKENRIQRVEFNDRIITLTAEHSCLLAANHGFDPHPRPLPIED